MMTKVLTLRFNPLTRAFVDQPLVDFTRDKNLIYVRNHFFTHDGLPFLVMVIDYRPVELLELEERCDPRRQREDHWREILSDQALPLFNTLRQWRSARSKADGMPPYLIATASRALGHLPVWPRLRTRPACSRIKVQVDRPVPAQVGQNPMPHGVW